MTSEKNFNVECPRFEDEFGGTGDCPKRDYAHPLDGTLVKYLDNGAVNAVFKGLLQMVADTTWGPVLASGIAVDEKNYPELNEAVEHCVKVLGIRRPYVIISAAVPGLNAITFGSDDKPYVALSPLMVRTMSIPQMKFVIGHECGHIAMGHVVYHSVLAIAAAFAGAIPVIGPVVDTVGFLPLKAWSRRSEISADRAGLLCCGDCQVAQKVLLQLEMPFMDADKLDVDSYVKNSETFMDEGLLRRLMEFNEAHPIIPKRIHALEVYVKSAKFCRVEGLPVPGDAMSDEALATQIEKIIKVL